MAKVVTIGEVLIDFVPEQKGTALKDVTTFTKAAGGAPANVAACVGKLGGQALLLSQVGQDAFGVHLKEVLAANHVDVSYVTTTSQAPTALAFVALDAKGNRDFRFYRQPCADLLYAPELIPADIFQPGDILHFGSVDLIESPMKKAHEKAIQMASQAGCLISFDPNVRKMLWPDLNLYQQTIRQFIPFADLIKISDDELRFVTKHESESHAIQSLFRGRVQWVIVTRGAKGASFYDHGSHRFDVPAIKVPVVDTTGAGDAFIGAILYQLVKHPHPTLNQWREMFEFATKTSAIVVSRPGAIPALPTLSDVLQFNVK